jgi:RHS repeat-associated protein
VARVAGGYTNSVPLDRLGSENAGNYYVWGEEKQTTGQNTEKFATYYRDATSGLDYADQRYYSSIMGRFLTPDPSSSSNALTIPQNWNRYAYVGGDPVNKTDPRGLCALQDDPPCYSVTGTGQMPGAGNGGGGGGGGGGLLMPDLGGGDSGTSSTGPSSGNTGITETQWWGLLTDWKGVLQTNLVQGLPDDCNKALAKLDAIKTPSRTGSISAQGLLTALQSVQFKNGVGSTDRYMSLFPGKTAPSGALAGMTVGDYFKANPGTSALAALGGNVVYFRPGRNSDEATIMHELLHNRGLEDSDIMSTLGLTGASVEISHFLWDDCLKPPVILMH